MWKAEVAKAARAKSDAEKAEKPKSDAGEAAKVRKAMASKKKQSEIAKSVGTSGQIRRPRSHTPNSDEESDMEGGTGVCLNCKQKGRTSTWEKKGKSKACIPCQQNKQVCNDPEGRGFWKRAQEDSEMPEVGPKKKARVQGSSAPDRLTLIADWILELTWAIEANTAELREGRRSQYEDRRVLQAMLSSLAEMAYLEERSELESGLEIEEGDIETLLEDVELNGWKQN